MRIFGRKIKIANTLPKIFSVVQIYIRSQKIFRDHHRLVMSYITRKPIKDRFVQLKDQSIIYLSGHTDDLTTVLINFCRAEYGKVNENDIVVDIGGNIGAFALFAARSGASKVISIEPNKASYEVLKKNIEINGYKSVVSAINGAISSKDDETVWIEQKASPHNELRKAKDIGLEAVKTISLKKIFELYNLTHIDLLKVDCEGAEYDMILNASRETLRIVSNIRIEIHPRGEKNASLIIENLILNGFYLTQKSNLVHWFKRKPSFHSPLSVS